jgi:hypothetical protein
MRGRLSPECWVQGRGLVRHTATLKSTQSNSGTSMFSSWNSFWTDSCLKYSVMCKMCCYFVYHKEQSSHTSYIITWCHLINSVFNHLDSCTQQRDKMTKLFSVLFLWISFRAKDTVRFFLHNLVFQYFKNVSNSAFLTKEQNRTLKLSSIIDGVSIAMLRSLTEIVAYPRKKSGLTLCCTASSPRRKLLS